MKDLEFFLKQNGFVISSTSDYEHVSAVKINPVDGNGVRFDIKAMPDGNYHVDRILVKKNSGNGVYPLDYMLEKDVELVKRYFTAPIE